MADEAYRAVFLRVHPTGKMVLSLTTEPDGQEAEYAQLVALLPAAFALDRDKSRREAVIIQSLCLSVPDVRKVTIDKLHAAGLTSLKTLFDAKADEVAQLLDVERAEASVHLRQLAHDVRGVGARVDGVAHEPVGEHGEVVPR